MKYFSTFSGIGGFEIGINNAYEIVKSNGKQQESSAFSRSPDSSITQSPESEQSSFWGDNTCIGYSEIDKYATAVYEYHFPEHKNYGDITKINATELPDFDLFVGGFPCQAFSIAGKRRGFDDTRGTLFFDIARILREKKPRWVVLENVKGLLSHDNGRTFKTIISTLVELGYGVEWQVLNAKNHGVPQNRERVIIVGNLGGERTGQVFPLGEDGREDIELPRHISNTLTARYEGAQATGTYVGEGKLDAQRQPLRFLGRNQKNIEGDYSFTVDASQTSGIRQGMKIRRLTPTECERLMGFPDGWTARGKKEGKEFEISDSQRYKMCGNAIVTNVVETVMERILTL